MDLVQLGADLVQVVGEARVRLRGNAFYESVRDPIAAVDTTGNIVPLANRLHVQVVGAEGEARLDVSRRIRAWLNGSFFRAEDSQTRASFRLLTDTPQARLNAGLSMPLGEWLNFDLTVELGAERRNNSRSALEALRRYRLPAYNLVTAQLRTETVADRFTFALTARNLFETGLVDDAYRPDRMPGGVPREGLSAFLTVRANL
jgi:outer membrane receptor for ferrienterochelin and colicin